VLYCDGSVRTVGWWQNVFKGKIERMDRANGDRIDVNLQKEVYLTVTT